MNERDEAQFAEMLRRDRIMWDLADRLSSWDLAVLTVHDPGGWLINSQCWALNRITRAGARRQPDFPKWKRELRVKTPINYIKVLTGEPSMIVCCEPTPRNFDAWVDVLPPTPAVLRTTKSDCWFYRRSVSRVPSGNVFAGGRMVVVSGERAYADIPFECADQVFAWPDIHEWPEYVPVPTWVRVRR